MLSLDLTLPTPQENIALDEAILEAAEAGEIQNEVVRIWCPDTPIVVLGRSSKHEQEVNLGYCESQQIPVIRRCSGGATILTAADCLMYAVLLRKNSRRELQNLDTTHDFVIERIRRAIENCGVETQMQGTCDVTIDNRKVSGNALRYKRQWLIYHGTLICQGMDLSLISNCLGTPARQPDYRNGREHENFLAAMPVSTEQLKSALFDVWQANEKLFPWPEQLTQKLASEKYLLDSWNFRH